MKPKKVNAVRLILLLSALFLIIASLSLYFSTAYINRQLLQSKESAATDIALLVKNNFKITDSEVEYMKSLTFNQMETDAINLRLMEVGDGVKLDAIITNVYILAPLSPVEYRYCPDKESAEFLGYSMDTPLDGVWLLNGFINEEGKFVPKQRDDIYRYTKLDECQKNGMQSKAAFGAYTSDAWGSFITGYAPIYTVEGNFVGLLGIDMDPDRYQNSAQQMILFMIGLFFTITLILLSLFLAFYIRYVKAREGKLQFEFYSRMSHDMRTPMNVILGMAELSREEENAHTLRRNMALVEESGKYMLGLVNDALNYQEIEAGNVAINRQILYYRDVYDGLLAMLVPLSRQKRIDFKVINDGVDLDGYVMIDDVHLKQVLLSIVGNAFKFTPEHGSVEVRISTQNAQGSFEECRVTVSDTGCGMSEEFIKANLFKPFRQEHPDMTSEMRGAGLGLALAKQLIDRMGGKISVESKQGIGSTVTIIFAVERVDEKRAVSAGTQRADSITKARAVIGGKRILLCEDHPINTLVTRKLIERVGGIMEGAVNGADGLDMFKAAPENYYNLVLMDIHMPVMDGLECARKIRATDRGDSKSVPIIALTANAYNEDVRETREAGMNAHLTKPIEPEEFYRTLSEAAISFESGIWFGRVIK
ncbi:MAG: ATP-binding protein [Eubacteriales bacterium]|nr:ATP-binding protein [Eubacteriales bacterium]MDD3882035.1 ATP-binding protein [Eubacteriales bacterium]MDD4512482.1 ATP-binding protein [Eubacteriales bacterium]